MLTREFQDADSEQLAELFFQTVRRINIRDYSPAQVSAWAPENRDMGKWRKSFEQKTVFVVEECGKIIGFGELETIGHIDRFYIHADWIGKGVGQSLYAAIESAAIAHRIFKLFTEASITAKPFFLRMGFSTVREQTVDVRGTLMNNFVMEKHLLA